MNHKDFLFCKLKKNEYHNSSLRKQFSTLLFNFCLILVDCAHPKCDDTF